MKKIALFVMVVALAVAVVACQGAVGPAGKDGAKGDKGDTGAQGPQGETGPPGQDGSPDNEPPMADTNIPTVYLTLNGIAYVKPTGADAVTAVGYKDKTVDLSEYFTDDKTLALSYKAVSEDKTIATVDANAKTGAVKSTGMLKITAVKAGETPITVTALDGQNDGVMATINVTVVETNSPPTVAVAKLVEDLTGKKKLNSSTMVNVPFTATITAGEGETEDSIADFRVEVHGVDKTKYVKADVKEGTTSGSYVLEVTRAKSGKDDKSVTDSITIFAQDRFGAEAMVDLNGGGTTDASLRAEANAPPRVKRELPTRIYLYARETAVTGDALDLLKQNGKYPNTRIKITDFFAVEMEDLGVLTDAADDVDGDTTCTFSTNPRQPTGQLILLAAAPATTGPPPTPQYPAVGTDQIMNNTKARVWNGVGVVEDTAERRDHFPATSARRAGGTPAEAVVDLNSAPDVVPASGEGATPVLVAATAAGTGTFNLTITCRDGETYKETSTTVEVFRS